MKQRNTEMEEVMQSDAKRSERCRKERDDLNRERESFIKGGDGR